MIRRWPRSTTKYRAKKDEVTVRENKGEPDQKLLNEKLYRRPMESKTP